MIPLNPISLKHYSPLTVILLHQLIIRDMADLELHNPGFDIEANLDGGSKTIRVQPDETSDGVEYFICSTGDQQITQIRLDEDGNWEQLWGDLSQKDIDAIGERIKEKES
jgi:hypothetical protein